MELPRLDPFHNSIDLLRFHLQFSPLNSSPVGYLFYSNGCSLGTIFANDKRFGLVDIGQRGLDGNAMERGKH
jgi:hypothetical protein